MAKLTNLQTKKSKSKRITVIDYGVGNIYSLAKALKKISNNIIVSEDANEILQSDALVLPGVGSFESGMNGLKIRGLIDPIKKFAEQNKPILGICLGAQLLLSSGYEFGTFKGLDIIPGEVKKFLDIKDKVPHTGWNEIYRSEKIKWDKTVLKSVKNNSDVYFVHSYIFHPKDKSNILAMTKYGDLEFCSAIYHKRIYGCQFHPEKSGKIGLDIIKNFIELI